jgi:hypothetical protein
MQKLLAAGLLYLSVIAIVLILKPRFMFTEAGNWKEFGIGRNPATHTWMPFWLFAVLWALISYTVVTILFAYQSGPATSVKQPSLNVVNETLEIEPEELSPPVSTRRSRRARGTPTELPDGYYVLNTAATEAAGGVPKYVYLGKGLPSDD